jgi:hypothetical protein
MTASITSTSAVLWRAVAGARSRSELINPVGRVEPASALSLDTPAPSNLAEVILYTPTGRRRHLAQPGQLDEAA